MPQPKTRPQRKEVEIMSENGDGLRALQEYAERRREREAKERALASLKAELAEADEDNTQELQTQVREAELAIRNLHEECTRLNRVFRSDPVKATKITGEGS